MRSQRRVRVLRKECRGREKAAGIREALVMDMERKSQCFELKATKTSQGPGEQLSPPNVTVFQSPKAKISHRERWNAVVSHRAFTMRAGRCCNRKYAEFKRAGEIARLVKTTAKAGYRFKKLAMSNGDKWATLLLADISMGAAFTTEKEECWGNEQAKIRPVSSTLLILANREGAAAFLEAGDQLEGVLLEHRAKAMPNVGRHSYERGVTNLAAEVRWSRGAQYYADAIIYGPDTWTSLHQEPGT